MSELLRTERLALVELLETLTAQQWQTPSLCAGWTVRDVAAHLAQAPSQSPVDAAAAMVRSGFRLNRMIADSAVRWSSRGTAVIVAQLRANAATGAGPLGVPAVAVLTDAVVHALDVRRPLGLPRAVPDEAFRRVAAFLTTARWPFTVPMAGGPRARVAGVRLVADDVGWQHGSGPEVRGSSESVLLLLAGRRVRPQDWGGAGAARLLTQSGR